MALTLYYAPGACSLSPHIALHEAGLEHHSIKADLKAHKLVDDGSDYYDVNPLGYVPVLEFDDGTRITEGPAIVQYIADQVPDKKLAPPNGTIERTKLQQWLNIIGTEIHKGFSPLFNPKTPDDYKAMTKDKLLSRLKWVDGRLAGRQYLMGDDFSVADGYLFVVTNWAKPLGIDLSPFANLGAWRERVGARPAVQKAMQAEGLTQ